MECIRGKKGGYRDFVPAEYEEKGGEGDGYILSFSDSPLDDENASENVYADILYNANDYVYITTPYLAIDSSLQNALCLAAKRGVDVRFITQEYRIRNGIPPDAVLLCLAYPRRSEDL